MKTFTLYNSETGELKGYAFGDTIQCGDLGMIETTTIGNSDLEYVNIKTGLLEHRPQFAISVDKTTIVANNTDTAKITGIPANTVCTYEEAEHTITDGEIDFTAEHAGEYILTFSLWPYIDYSTTITATEAT